MPSVTEIQAVPDRRVAPYVAASACFPLILLLVNNSWVFIPPSGIDPWVYTGYFLDLKHLLNAFPDAYYGSRLPWVLLGRIVHRLTPSPEVAQYTLRLILYEISTLSLFAVVHMLFENALAATLAALVLGSSTFFLWAIGWDYVDGFGIAVILSTLACLTAAATRGHRRFWLMCAGFAYISIVSTNVTLVLITPFLIGGYLFADARDREGAFGGGLGWFGLGAGCAVAAYGAVNWFLAGRFWFLQPQLTAALAMGTDRTALKLPIKEWITHASWLLFPLIALVTALVLLSRLIYARVTDGRWTEVDRRAALCAVLLIGLEVLFMALEATRFVLALQVSYYASYLIPHASICIGAALAVSTSQISRKWDSLIVASTAAGLLIFFIGPFHLWLPTITRGFGPLNLVFSANGIGALGGMAGVVCMLLAVSTLLKRAWLTVIALCALGLCNASAADTTPLSFPPSSTGHSRNLMAFDVIRALTPYNRDGKLMFWYDLKEPLGGVFRAASSAHLWARRLISEDFPQRTPPLPGMTLDLEGSERTIAILSSSRDALARADESLAQIWVRPEPIDRLEVERGGDRFTVNVVHVLPRGVPWQLSLNDFDPAVASRPLSRMPDGDVIVRTEPVPWTFAAIMAVRPSERDRVKGCRGFITIRVSVQGGPIGLGVLDLDRQRFLVRQPVSQTSAPVEVRMQVPRLGEVGYVVVQAWEMPNAAVVE